MFDAKEMHRFNGKVFETQLWDLFMFTLREETEELVAVAEGFGLV